jgi:muramoyltetrapeptide carboxypeptidase
LAFFEAAVSLLYFGVVNRKHFLQTILPVGLGAFFLKNAWAFSDPVIQPVWSFTPKYLQPGDTIAITCPASPLDAEEARNCVNALKSWGYKIKMGQTVGDHWQRFGGTDEERAADLQACLDDDNVAAVLFGRGGYGVMRIMDKINWEKFALKPKWLVGYSDITAIHCHVNAVYGIPTLHADMANGFNGTEDQALLSMKRALSGGIINYTFPGYEGNKSGLVTGELVGGNLSLIYAMQASKSELKTDGKILLIEDVSEYKYTVDRMLMNLKRSGKLENLAALAVGSFTATKTDTETSFPMSIEEIIYDKVKEYSYPVCFHFPAGHQRLNLALKLGVNYQFTVGRSSCNLTEVPLQQIKKIETPLLPDSLQAAELMNNVPDTAIVNRP